MSTKVSREEMHQPASIGAAAVALRLLDDLVQERERLGNSEDDEALHDFRVALRRLRSWLRAFRPCLEDRLRRRAVRRLSRIADASNASRDAEVQLDWLRTARRATRGNERRALDWLVARLDERRSEADDSLRRRIAKDFDRARKALASLAEPADDEAPDEAAPNGGGAGDEAPDDAAGGAAGDTEAEEGESLALAAAANVRAHTDELRQQLAAVRSIDDQPEAHEARIAAKRVRYLLEPFVDQLEGGKDAIRVLKEFQDVVGELHDAHVLITEIADAVVDAASERAGRIASAILDGDDGQGAELTPGSLEAGLVALARRARARMQRRYSALAERWLGGGGDTFIAGLVMISAHLEIAGTLPGAAHESNSEIERKYLLHALPEEARSAPVVEIEQGYLPGKRLAERLRRTTDGAGEHWYRTMKMGAGLVRTEIEEETTRDVFDAMWPLTTGRRVQKRRYRVSDGALTWEIDDFLDRELVLAEVELARADDRVEPPAWLAPHVVREVTDDAAYENRNLAR